MFDRSLPGAPAAFLIAVLLAGCATSAREATPPDAATESSAPSTDAGGESPPQSLCGPPAGLSGTPSSVAEVIALANAMLVRQPAGQGLTLPCFLESLDRPLTVLASAGQFSAQPATGVRSPRLFLFSSNLVLSVAPAGAGAELLELGEYVTPTRSIKGEIAFPLRQQLSPAAAYQRIALQGSTHCGICHGPEEPVLDEGLADRFISDVIRPATDEVIALPFVDAQRLACDADQEPWRCQILTAVFGHGPVTQGAFSKDARTIYGN